LITDREGAIAATAEALVVVVGIVIIVFVQQRGHGSACAFGLYGMPPPE
jgi:hypothetical protein